jgi:hypothetical protein
MDPSNGENRIDELIDERGVLEAQRDHYRERCDELEAELRRAREQLNRGLKMKDLDTSDPTVFQGESLQRMREWKRCVEFVIDEKEDAEELGKTGASTKIGTKPETVLPFSQVGLSGFLTKNHRLTQKYTEYPDMKPKRKAADNATTTSPKPNDTKSS